MNTLEEFEEEFIKSQEPLGEEFTKVLYDNLWDLITNKEETNIKTGEDNMNIIALYIDNGRDVVASLLEETETHYIVEHAEMLVPVETENGMASSMMPMSMLPHKRFTFKKDSVNAVMYHEDVPSELINYFVKKHSGIVIAKAI